MKKIIFLLSFLVCWACQSESKKIQFSGTEIDKVVQEMTEMMIHDVSNPPLAMRFFSYACLAGYQVMTEADSSLNAFQYQFNGYPSFTKDKPVEAPEFTAILAMMEVSQKMQPSGGRMKEFEAHYIDSCRQLGLSDQVIETSTQKAQAVAKGILAYAKADGYNKLSNFPKYTPKKTAGSWYSTPPGYFPAVEPYFYRIRSFSLDTNKIDEIPAPAPYSESNSSNFYALSKAVYEANKSEANLKIAAFWDCNPFALNDQGHLLIGMKKISPGAHWMGIAGIASAKNNTSFGKSLEIRTALATSLMDAFWLCWREKYHSHRIRPETAIRKLIDPTWKPFLQTPPFPEYPSGHSTVSTTAAIVLTHFFGPNFAYTDTVEKRYGIDDRSFTSFEAAAEEASISRFYGGIHYMDGIQAGQAQGRILGKHFLTLLKHEN